MKLNYSIQEVSEDQVRGMVRDLDISFKDAVMISDNLRGMKLAKAIELLERVLEKKQPIRYGRYNIGIGHRAGNQPKIGKYPVKAAGKALELLRNIEANADYRGIDTVSLTIKYIQANQGIGRTKRKPKGRWARWTTQFVSIQAVAEGS